MRHLATITLGLATLLSSSAAMADVRFHVPMPWMHLGHGPVRVDVAPAYEAPPPAWQYRRPYYGAVVVHPTAYVSTPGYYGYGPRRDSDPALFTARVRAQVSSIDGDIRYHIAQGTISPDAVAALDAGRDEVERDLADACAKGYLTDDDRAHIEQHVDELRALRDQYRIERGGWYREYGER